MNAQAADGPRFQTESQGGRFRVERIEFQTVIGYLHDKLTWGGNGTGDGHIPQHAVWIGVSADVRKQFFDQEIDLVDACVRQARVERTLANELRDGPETPGGRGLW